jgi:uncharacterized protein YjiS (DUF1127 family)
MELTMTTLIEIFAAYRQSRRRQAAIRDLKRLSAEQLDDIGISPDRIGEVVDALLARPASFNTSARIKPEFKLRRLAPRQV